MGLLPRLSINGGSTAVNSFDRDVIQSYGSVMTCGVALLCNERHVSILQQLHVKRKSEGKFVVASSMKTWGGRVQVLLHTFLTSALD
jgi:hypothetical protein